MSTLFSEFLESSAKFSPCKTYRYELVRAWDSDLPEICWAMLNPSTADHLVLDPTLRRCLAFSRQWGYGVMRIVNLFALRSTDPKNLVLWHGDVVGPGNDATIVRAAKSADRLVVGWGVHGHLFDRDKAVMKLLADANTQPWCLGITKEGQPKHPLYLASKTELMEYKHVG